MNVSLNAAAVGRSGAQPRAVRLYLRHSARPRERHQSAAQPDFNAALRIPGMLAMGAEAELTTTVVEAVLEVAAEAWWC